MCNLYLWLACWLFSRSTVRPDKVLDFGAAHSEALALIQREWMRARQRVEAEPDAGDSFVERAHQVLDQVHAAFILPDLSFEKHRKLMTRLLRQPAMCTNTSEATDLLRIIDGGQASCRMFLRIDMRTVSDAAVGVCCAQWQARGYPRTTSDLEEDGREFAALEQMLEPNGRLRSENPPPRPAAEPTTRSEGLRQLPGTCLFIGSTLGSRQTQMCSALSGQQPGSQQFVRLRFERIL
jgi:hypothetical protein